LYGRWIKGSIGGEADRQADEGGWFTQSALVTPSAEKILKQHKITWRPGPVDPEIRDLPLTRVEVGRYQKRVNEEFDKIVHTMSQDADWQKLPASQKQAVLQRVMTRIRDGLRGELMGGIPEKDLNRRITDNKLEKAAK
jgi:hypothetical protein